MARSGLTTGNIDVTPLSETIIMDIVQGEQLELPVTLDIFEFSDPDDGFEYEYVILEGVNDGAGTIPSTYKTDGYQTTLNVRIPNNRGAWLNTTAYTLEDVVSFENKSYKLNVGTNYINDINPALNPLWLEHDPTTVYLSFPSNLGFGWAPGPAIGFPVYGFIELRVTEPNNNTYRRTWKPVRGLVKILFSPTMLVTPDTVLEPTTTVGSVLRYSGSTGWIYSPALIITDGGDVSITGTLNISGGSLDLTAGLQSTGAGANSFRAGVNAGAATQGSNAVAVGYLAGNNMQGESSVAIGYVAGMSAQGVKAVSLGYKAGQSTQGANSVAVGNSAGNITQGNNGVAIGNTAGNDTQGVAAVAIGRLAGQTTQGTNSIAVGNAAGNTNQGATGIIINSSGAALNDTTAGHIHIASSLGSIDFKNADGWTATDSVGTFSLRNDDYADNSIKAQHLDVTGNGTSSQYLRSDGDGTFTWATPTADFNTSGHYYLGNNDWGSLVSTSSGTMTYSQDHQGMSFNGAQNISSAIRCQVPIDPTAHYRIKVRVKQITTTTGTGIFYAAVKTLNEDKTNLSSDLANTYNYGIASGQTLTAGTTYTFEDTFSGYNTSTDPGPGTGDRQKFDPEGKYFDLLIITNYQGSGETVIQSIEVERLPDAIWLGDAILVDASRNILNPGLVDGRDVEADGIKVDTTYGWGDHSLATYATETYVGTQVTAAVIMPLLNDSGLTTNTAIGSSALGSNLTGTMNTAFGSNALQNSTASSNLGIGNNAGSAITSGANNTIIGNLAGTETLNQTLLIASGSIPRIKVDNAGIVLNDGIDFKINGSRLIARGPNNIAGNTLIGDGASATPFADISGTDNTIIGRDAGQSLTTGFNNIAMGYLTIPFNQIGTHNTSIGRLSLGYLGANVTAAMNAASENQNLWQSYSYNIGIGDSAGAAIVSGRGNVVIGCHLAENNLVNTVLFGVGNPFAKVERLRLDGDGLRLNGSATTTTSLNMNNTESQFTGNVRIMQHAQDGAGATFKLSSGDRANNWIFQNTAAGVLTIESDDPLMYGKLVLQSNWVTATGELNLAQQTGSAIGGSLRFNNNDSVPASSDQDWLIRSNGGTNPSLSFFTAEGATVGNSATLSWGQSTFSITSDERRKDISSNVENATEMLSELRTVYFTYNNEPLENRKPHIGLLAQDVQKVLPLAVDADSEGILSMRYESIITVLVKANQEQEEKNQEQQALIQSLIGRIEALENK